MTLTILLSKNPPQAVAQNFVYFTFAIAFTTVCDKLDIENHKVKLIEIHFLEDMDFKYFMETFFDDDDLAKNEQVVKAFVDSI